MKQAAGGTLEEGGGWKERQSQVGEVREERQTGSAAFNHTKFTQCVENETAAMSHIITRFSRSQNRAAPCLPPPFRLFHFSIILLLYFPRFPLFLKVGSFITPLLPPSFLHVFFFSRLPFCSWTSVCLFFFFSPSLGSVGRKRSHFRPH